MAQSKVSICNVALAMLGADAIRAFDENNKRSRMCDVFFDFTRDYLLTKFDWPFARKLLQLQQLDPVADNLVVPAGWYPYGLPSDCRTPRDLHPPGSKDPWKVSGHVLYCQKASEVYLYYTMQQVDVSKFSDTFSNLLALGIAVKLSPAVTQDAKLTTSLAGQFLNEQNDAWESDANIGNNYREFDETPDNDSFVNPDGYIDSDLGWAR